MSDRHEFIVETTIGLARFRLPADAIGLGQSVVQVAYNALTRDEREVEVREPVGGKWHVRRFNPDHVVSVREAAS